MAERLAIPAAIEAVDAAWLTAALFGGVAHGVARPRGAGDDATAVAGVRQADAAGGIAVTSRVARLLLDLEPPGAAPRSVIVKLPNPAWSGGPQLYEREVRFYRELASRHALPAPRCFYADYDGDTGGFVLVLEDFTDASPGHRLAGMSADEAAIALAAMARVHASWWESPRLAGWPTKSYDPAHARRILHTFQDRWPRLRAMGEYAVSARLARAADALAPGFVDGLLALSRGPRTLIHADLHAENLLIDSAGPGGHDAGGGPRFVAIDWQNASLGHPAFDVANLLGSTHADAQRAHRGALLAGYHAALCAGGVRDYGLARCEADTAAAVRWLFAGVASWLVTFEVERLRDAATVQGHFARLSAALLDQS